MRDVKEVLARADHSLLADALGVIALATLLIGALHLPGLV
jgi:hypothetical protein